METIEIKNLKKNFGKTQALDGISLSIGKGEIFGFLGPNGAGKTTTLSIIMDFLRPTSGQVFINGQDANVNSGLLKQEMGYISADAHFYEGLTAKEHFQLINDLRGRSSNLTELLNDFDFNPNKRARELSTGNRQKLAIIMALMHDPKILIMDEPTRGLDPIYQNVFYKWLQKLSKQGATIFMSSHNLFEVENICTKIAIIKLGKVVALEDIKSLHQKKMHIVEMEMESASGSESAQGMSPHSRLDLKIFDDPQFEIIESTLTRIKLKVSGDINRFLILLPQVKVKDLVISHATLEEIFLEYYEN
jgi:ABC-2 type transport system ATP-binding protein